MSWRMRLFAIVSIVIFSVLCRGRLAAGQSWGHRLLPPKPIAPEVTRHRNVPRIIPPTTLSVTNGDRATPAPPAVPSRNSDLEISYARGGLCGQAAAPARGERRAVIVGYDLKKVAYPWGYFGAEVGSRTAGRSDYQNRAWRWTIYPGYPPAK